MSKVIEPFFTHEGEDGFGIKVFGDPSEDIKLWVTDVAAPTNPNWKQTDPYGDLICGATLTPADANRLAVALSAAAITDTLARVELLLPNIRIVDGFPGITYLVGGRRYNYDTLSELLAAHGGEK